MAKKYSEENPIKDIENLNPSLRPSEKSINFILNYSKSLQVNTSKKIGNLFLSLN